MYNSLRGASMPHIRFRAVKNEYIQELSALLCKDLAKEMGTSEDNFTFEGVATQFYSQGKATESYPFVEVLLFERPQALQDRCAVIITEHLKRIGKYEDVIVVFQSLPKYKYYENGKHY